MWVISCTDAHWEGKRKWLRPGTKHLFGRSSTKPDDVDRAHYISHKSVSRKHFYVTVADVSSSATTSLHSKSSVTIEGAGKTGTWLNGQRLPGDDQTRTLDGNKYIFQLGNPEATLTLEWRPVVLAFTTGVTKSAKAKGTALAAERERVDRCDIKLTTEYISNITTHAIAKKRNTSPVLQALLQGVWVVTASYFDALAAACKQDGKEQDGSPRPSLLEQDFEKHWPKEDEHICPTGGEPITRPDSWLQPNAARAELFHDYTFVFLDRAQHASLAPAINAGGGKALCYEFEHGKTSVQEVIKYVKELAGKKHSHRFSLAEMPGPGGIVLVRARDIDVLRNAQLKLDEALEQTSIEQGEFLDAILSVNAQVLRRPLQQTTEEDEAPVPSQAGDQPISSSIPAPPMDSAALSGRPPASSSVPPPPQGTLDGSNIQEPPNVEGSQPPRHGQDSAQLERQENQVETTAEAAPAPPARKRRRFITQKFQGFDDFEPSSIARVTSKSPGPSVLQPSHTQATSERSEDVEESSARPHASHRKLDKRPVPVEAEEEGEETAEQRHERIYPAQAAFKRRKTEAAAAAAAAATDIDISTKQATPAPKDVEKDGPNIDKTKGKGKKSKQDADLKAKITARREAEEEQHRLEEERLRQGLEPGEEIPMLGKKQEMLVEYKLPIREQQPAITVSDNPAWAGRPNYKKFKKRRPGDQELVRAETSNAGAVAMVALEEISSRGNGLGEEHWLEYGDMHPRHIKQKKTQTQSQGRASQSDRNHTPQASSSANNLEGNAREEVDNEERAVFRRRLHSSRQEDEDEAEANAMFDAPRGSKSTSGFASQSTLGTDTQKKAAGKRPATNQLVPATAKKPRQTIATVAVSTRNGSGLPASTSLDDDDEDEDPRAFRRKRR